MSKTIRLVPTKYDFRMVRIPMPPGTRPLHPRSVEAVSQSRKYRVSGPEERKSPVGETNLFGSGGTQDDGMFCANEHLVLDAHSEAVKVFGELEIGRDVDAF